MNVLGQQLEETRNFEDLNQAQRDFIKEQLCNWTTLQFYEEDKKYDEALEREYKITKYIDFSCNIVPKVSND